MGTTTESAAEIRAAYKRKGWSSRMVSVRTEYFSMGSAIQVTIKSPDVDESEAKRIAEGAERIHRCQVTGEILGGGNRYVSVGHSEGCREIMARRHLAALTDALAELRLCVAIGEPNRLIPIVGSGADVGMENPHTAQIWIDGRMQGTFYPNNESGLQGGAFTLALLLDRKASAERLAQRVPGLL